MALHTMFTPTSSCNFYSGKEKYRIQIRSPLSKKRVTKSLNQAWAGTNTAFEPQRCVETLVIDSSKRNLPISHWSPSKPFGHAHLKPPIWSEQVPLLRQGRFAQSSISIWTKKGIFYNDWNWCRNMIRQFAVVDKNRDNTAWVNVSRNDQALLESFY